LECGKLMKWVDPTIQIIACGFPVGDWNRIVLSKLIHVADYISLHDYEGSDDYYEMLGSIKKVERVIQLTIDAIDSTDVLRGEPSPLNASMPESRHKKPIKIAFDEWNIMYRKHDLWNREGKPPVEEIYNLRDALWVASVLNLFQRMGDKVTMANIAQLLNSIGTMFTDPNGMFLQTIYFPMKLYRKECGVLALRSDVESPTFSSKTFKDVPYLDVSASMDDAHKVVSVAVVNRHESAPVKAALAIQNASLARGATAFEINGASADAENSFAHPENVRINQRSVTDVGEKFSYTFPAHSVTVLKMQLR
jgi:alpha-L-arabinofuranosidase